MKITKIFLTTYGEKKWLNKMAHDGFELTKRRGATYIFEKTKDDIFYQYVFLKKGRQSFLALDYKKKDSDAQAIYGNGFVALFKKKGEAPSILPREELKLNLLRHKQKRTTAYLCYMMAGLCCSMVARFLWPLWIAAALCLTVCFLYIAEVKGTDKMVKEL